MHASTQRSRLPPCNYTMRVDVGAELLEAGVHTGVIETALGVVIDHARTVTTNPRDHQGVSTRSLSCRCNRKVSFQQPLTHIESPWPKRQSCGPRLQTCPSAVCSNT